jgi:polyisoprenyl-phosphate glycosyltransferase
MPTLSYIIPCYFNGENLPITTQTLIANEKLFSQAIDFEYVMIDDGSKDNTWEELQKFQALYPNKVKAIKLARNVGAFNAILAGMHHTKGDCQVVLTADLQDPPELIPQMLDHWQRGIKLVIANRQDRQESFTQKIFSNTFHYLMKTYAMPHLPTGGYDLVLFDRQLCQEVIKINEKNSHTLYLLAWLGYEYVTIPYTRRKREIGKSRWTLQKKIKLFVDSFVEFSFFPIRAISVMGILLGVAAFLYGLFVVAARLTGFIHLEGWSSLMIVLLFVSSFQMIALGIIGEYVWRVLDSTRNRPNFVIEKIIVT